MSFLARLTAAFRPAPPTPSAELAQLRAVALAAQALVRTAQSGWGMPANVEVVDERALTKLESALAAAGMDMSAEELEGSL
jgi:hypothetical protein